MAALMITTLSGRWWWIFSRFFYWHIKPKLFSPLLSPILVNIPRRYGMIMAWWKVFKKVWWCAICARQQLLHCISTRSWQFLAKRQQFSNVCISFSILQTRMMSKSWCGIVDPSFHTPLLLLWFFWEEDEETLCSMLLLYSFSKPLGSYQKHER